MQTLRRGVVDRQQAEGWPCASELERAIGERDDVELRLVAFVRPVMPAADLDRAPAKYQGRTFPPPARHAARVLRFHEAILS